MSTVKPKKKCCVSKPRCKRCPLRMLAEGTLPAGYTVRHRKLVAVGKEHARDGAALTTAVRPSSDDRDSKRARKAAKKSRKKADQKRQKKAGKK